ncbi:hypothetical protein SAMN05880501_113109 [Ureibacillus xyleni]|uniref:Uncharacterized protein n=1 Tax=Ureibacillus xyleni TaxID=614648 RepID=A0A285TJ09_9BACL|nr:hypothetical protein [Ureibacillus xyleni]SOC22012.1 hypothetical protein SAMN05880501_113109 [Ureibacillus xyleni]
MSHLLKTNIRELAKRQYKVYMGEFVIFSSAMELLIWLSSEMTHFELENLAYQLGNTTAEELVKSGCDTPAEAYVFEHDYVFVLQDQQGKLFVYSCDFVDMDEEFSPIGEQPCE